MKPMHEGQIAQAVQLLDLMLEFFGDDGHWARGCYDDGNGGHCLVGALLHLSRKHRLPTAPAIALLPASPEDLRDRGWGQNPPEIGRSEWQKCWADFALEVWGQKQ
jgi:hypothetical protein